MRSATSARKHAAAGLAIFTVVVTPSLASATGYELVRGKKEAICMTMLSNLKEFHNQLPQTCRIAVSDKYPELTLPQWRQLDAQKSTGLVEKAERARYGVSGNGDQGKATVAREVSRLVSEHAKAGSLSARQTRLTLAGSEEVVVLSYDFGCEQGSSWSIATSRLAVFEESGKVDPRFQTLFGAEIIYWKGAPYVVTSSPKPAAAYRGDSGPRADHEGYLLVHRYEWIPPGTPGVGAERGRGAVDKLVCQIGINRIGGAK